MNAQFYQCNLGGRQRGWPAKVLLAAVVVLVGAAIVFAWHVYSGGIYEQKTIGALAFRTLLTGAFYFGAARLGNTLQDQSNGTGNFVVWGSSTLEGNIAAGQTVTVQAHGSLGHAPRGSHGFGYDPLFVLPDGRALAELSPDEKNALSHRARAFEAARPHLLALLRAEALP